MLIVRLLLVSSFVIIASSLFSQTYLVDNYGALGDGVTDDRDAIQNAISDLRNTGGTLQFTSGKTYIISEGLNFYNFSATHDYLVTSTGTDKATIKIQDGAPLTWPHWGMRLSNSNNITIENLTIDGNRDTRNPTVETSGTDVLFIDGACDGTRLKNLNMINSPMDNLYIVVHENSGQTQMTDFEMHNCILENGFRNNMSVISGENFKIIACEFNNANGTDPQSGIDFEPNNGSANGYKNMTVEGCKFKDNVRYGIELTYIIDGSGSSTIKNNYFENNGILVGSKNNSIHHNIFAKQDHQHLHTSQTRDGIIYFHANGYGENNDVFNNYFYDNPMPAGSHLVNFMYNSGGNNHLHDNYGYGNTVAGFVSNNTNPNTPPQIISNNVFINRRETAYWTMDNNDISGGIIDDLSYFDKDGTLYNSPVSTTGKVNEALDFSPDDKYIEIDTGNNLNIQMNITLSAWIKWNGDNPNETEQVIIGRGDDWRFGINNSGQLGFYAPQSSDTSFTAGWVQAGIDDAIASGEWHFVAFTYNGRYARLFIDADEVAVEQANGVLGTAFDKIFIGSLNTTTYSFNGIIDEVKIQNYALSRDEIEQLQGINYYVDFTGGDDAAQGTGPATAWKTIAKVNAEMNTFKAGDSILFKRGERWDGERLLSDTHPSGTMSNPIVYGAYGTGAKPIININTVQNVNWTNEGDSIWSTITPTGSRYFKNGDEMLRAVESSYLGLYGTEFFDTCQNDCQQLKLYVFTGEDPAQYDYAWSPSSYVIGLRYTDYINLVDLDIRGGASSSIRVFDNKNWKILNCNIGKNAAYGIKVKNSSDILIDNCNIDSYFTVDMSQLPVGTSSYTGCNDGVFVSSGSTAVTIKNCFFKNWEHASFGSNTTDSLNKISNIIFCNNELTAPDILYGGRIGYSGYSEDGEYYNNYIHNIRTPNQLGGSGNHFHHNIIDTVLHSPLEYYVYAIGVKLSNYNIHVKNNIIENNVIKNTEGKGMEIYSINFDYPGEVSGNILRNNILYNCGILDNDIAVQFHEDSSGQLIYNNIMENNLIFNSNTSQTCLYQYGGTVSDVATFNTMNEHIRNNIAADPLFVDAQNEDFHLQANSPCIDAGTGGLSTRDYDNNPIPLQDNTDIGLYEYGIYWTGSISHYWNIAENWSSGQVPAATDSVTIPAPAYYKFYPEVHNNTQIRKLYLNDNAKLILMTGKVLNMGQ